MRFLIDADLPRRTVDVLVSAGHVSSHVEDVGLGSADDPTIAAYALAHDMCLITGDFGFADIRNYPPQNYKGIVVLELPRNATAQQILNLVEHLVSQSSILNSIPGRLAVVSPGRVRLRPAP